MAVKSRKWPFGWVFELGSLVALFGAWFVSNLFDDSRFARFAAAVLVFLAISLFFWLLDRASRKRRSSKNAL